MLKNIFKILILCVLIFSSKSAYADNFQNGVKAYGSGNYKYAESCFRQAIQSNPNSDTTKYYLAITLVRNKNIADAKYLYKNIIDTSSNQEVINLSRKGLQLLGDSSYSSNSYSRVNKAVLNINTMGNIIIVSNVNLNDAVNTNFIFDTGASYTTISTEVARKLKISTANAPKLKIMTGSGYIEAPKVFIKKIEIKGMSVYNVEALIADLPMHNSGGGGDVAGLLGLSFMKDFKVTVDKAHNQITLEKN